jgi:hypothetical protein
MPKMKVHPGMLMKTKEGRFQVPDVSGREAGCRGQVTGNSGRTPRTGGDRWQPVRIHAKNEGASGYVDENK